MSLLIYSARRIFAMIPLMIGISILNFTIFAMTPIDPVSGFIGLDEDAAFSRELIAQQWGLHKPIYQRYLDWAIPLFTKLEFGNSWFQAKPVVDVILPRIEKTVLLFGLAFFFTIVISTITGIVAAVNHNSFYDQTALFATLVGLSIPNFVLGLLIIVAWASITGNPPLYDGYIHRKPLDYIHVIIAANITIIVSSTAFLTRLVRSQLLNVLRQNYIKTARAKGLSERTVIYKHALRNALLPFVTVVALSLPAILGGSAVIELVFNYPGVGREIIKAAQNFDMPLVLGINMFFGFMSVFMLLVAEILYALVDPRIKF